MNNAVICSAHIHFPQPLGPEVMSLKVIRAKFLFNYEVNSDLISLSRYLFYITTALLLQLRSSYAGYTF